MEAQPDSAVKAVPLALQAAIDAPSLERRSWHWSIGPKYIGLFLWVAYFDSIGRRALPMGGLLPSVIGAAVGAFLAFSLFYYLPALWGQKTGRGLIPLASSTFGSEGVRWVPGLLDLCGQILWMAVATSVATDLILNGLVSGRFIDAGLVSQMGRIKLGPIPSKGGLFLVASFFWMLWASLVGRYLVRVIAALMNIFPVFPALMLALAVVLLLPKVGAYRGSGYDPDAMQEVTQGSFHAVTLVIQMVLGFFAISALTAPDWGAVCRERRDVREGGLVGIGFAAWIIATLAILAVLGAAGKEELRRAAGQVLVIHESPWRFTFQAAVTQGIGGSWACAILLLMGLQSLAPTVFAAHVVGDRFESFSNGRINPLAGTLIAATIAWLLMSVGKLSLTYRLEIIFTITGAFYAPVLGALASDAIRRRFEWPGPRQGWNLAGLASWAVGVTVGLLPLWFGSWSAGPRWLAPEPSALFAFLAAFGAHALLCRTTLEGKVIPYVSHGPEMSEPGPNQSKT